MKIAAIFFNPAKKQAQKLASTIQKLLTRKNLKALCIPSSQNKVPKVDFALSLGGDGTMLKTSRKIAPLGVPVLGINMGSLGFLAETDPKETKIVLEKLIQGNYHVEERMMLDVKLQSKGKTIKNIALNDCTIQSGASGRVVKTSVCIDGSFVADYVSDGLIISTPTGSTAYSLAASGPIVYPALSLFILTPICPHTLTQRPLILSDNQEISISTKNNIEAEKPVLIIDGQINYTLSQNDKITISKAKQPLKLILNPRTKYFNILRTKLKWAERG